MTTARTITTAKPASPPAAGEIPWYELLDVPEPPEDGMLEDDVITQIKMVLLARYANDQSVLVAGPAAYLVYDSERPGSFVSPDCYVVFGVDTRVIRSERRSYRIDEWNMPPAFVLEVASPSTAARDLTEKRAIYARMGAQEYWRLDKMVENYGQPLVGERLVDGEYVRYELHTEPNGDVWSRSEVLGVDFYYRVQNGVGTFSLRDSATGEWLNLLSEEIAARRASDARARASDARAQAADARTQDAETRAQASDARAQSADARARASDARAQSADARTQDAETRAQASDVRAETAEAQVQAERERNRELRAELERLRRQLDGR